MPNQTGASRVLYSSAKYHSTTLFTTIYHPSSSASPLPALCLSVSVSLVFVSPSLFDPQGLSCSHYSAYCVSSCTTLSSCTRRHLPTTAYTDAVKPALTHPAHSNRTKLASDVYLKLQGSPSTPKGAATRGFASHFGRNKPPNLPVSFTPRGAQVAPSQTQHSHCLVQTIKTSQQSILSPSRNPLLSPSQPPSHLSLSPVSITEAVTRH